MIDRHYLNTATRTGTLYAAYSTSSVPACRELAPRIACAVEAAVATGLTTEHDYMCVANCEGHVETQCPDVVLFGTACAPMSPTECATKMQEARVLLQQ